MSKMKKTYNLTNAKGGAAVTIICNRHKTKQGWGKINKDGNIEYFIPEGLKDSDRDDFNYHSIFQNLKNQSGPNRNLFGQARSNDCYYNRRRFGSG